MNRRNNRRKKNPSQNPIKVTFDVCSYNLLRLFLKFKAMVHPAPRRKATYTQLRGDLRTHIEDRTMDEIIWWPVCWGLWQHNIHPRGCRHQILASGVHRLIKICNTCYVTIGNRNYSGNRNSETPKSY